MEVMDNCSQLEFHALKLDIKDGSSLVICCTMNDVEGGESDMPLVIEGFESVDKAIVVSAC